MRLENIVNQIERGLREVENSRTPEKAIEEYRRVLSQIEKIKELPQNTMRKVRKIGLKAYSLAVNKRIKKANSLLEKGNSSAALFEYNAARELAIEGGVGFQKNKTLMERIYAEEAIRQIINAEKHVTRGEVKKAEEAYKKATQNATIAQTKLPETKEKTLLEKITKQYIKKPYTDENIRAIQGYIKRLPELRILYAEEAIRQIKDAEMYIKRGEVKKAEEAYKKATQNATIAQTKLPETKEKTILKAMIGAYISSKRKKGGTNNPLKEKSRIIQLAAYYEGMLGGKLAAKNRRYLEGLYRAA